MKFRVKHLIKLLKKQLGNGVVVDIIDENNDIIYGRVTIGKTDLRFGKFPRRILSKVVGQIAFQPEETPFRVTAFVM